MGLARCFAAQYLCALVLTHRIDPQTGVVSCFFQTIFLFLVLMLAQLMSVAGVIEK